MAEVDLQKVVRNMLRDISVGVGDEFDQNFERQSYFTKAWQRRKSPLRPGGHILVDRDRLRGSIHSRTTADSITFYSDLPYAAIHNEGGEIKVTHRMKCYFWRKFYEARGSFGRKKNGELRQDKRNRRLGTEADFWRAMALMREGSTIKIPRRQFVGMAPEVEQTVRGIIERNLEKYFKHIKI